MQCGSLAGPDLPHSPPPTTPRLAQRYCRDSTLSVGTPRVPTLGLGGLDVWASAAATSEPCKPGLYLSTAPSSHWEACTEGSLLLLGEE